MSNRNVIIGDLDGSFNNSAGQTFAVPGADISQNILSQFTVELDDFVSNSPRSGLTGFRTFVLAIDQQNEVVSQLDWRSAPQVTSNASDFESFSFNPLDSNGDRFVLDPNLLYALLISSADQDTSNVNDRFASDIPAVVGDGSAYGDGSGSV